LVKIENFIDASTGIIRKCPAYGFFISFMQSILMEELCFTKLAFLECSNSLSVRPKPLRGAIKLFNQITITKFNGWKKLAD